MLLKGTSAREMAFYKKETDSGAAVAGTSASL